MFELTACENGCTERISLGVYDTVDEAEEAWEASFADDYEIPDIVEIETGQRQYDDEPGVEDDEGDDDEQDEDEPFLQDPSPLGYGRDWDDDEHPNPSGLAYGGKEWEPEEHPNPGALGYKVDGKRRKSAGRFQLIGLLRFDQGAKDRYGDEVLIGSFATQDEAEAAWRNRYQGRPYETGTILDTETGNRVRRSFKGSPITKRAKGKIVERDDEERSATFILSVSGVIDRDGESVDVDGIDTANFKRTGGPVLNNHDSDELPIGKSEVWTEDRIIEGERRRCLMGKVTFSKANPEADSIWGMVEEGVVNSASVSFIPNGADSISRNREGGNHYKEAELIEWSLVGIPSLPMATKVKRMKRSPSEPSLSPTQELELALLVQDIQEDTIKTALGRLQRRARGAW